MINFTLCCHYCDDSFDSWFGSSSDYEEQKKNGLLECPICGSHSIEKGLMAPAIKTSGDKKYDPKATLRQARQYIENNFENVGERFADEAIAINRGEADSRNIYGKIDDEARDRLSDEGIDYVEVPWVNKHDA